MGIDIPDLYYDIFYLNSDFSISKVIYMLIYKN